MATEPMTDAELAANDQIGYWLSADNWCRLPTALRSKFQPYMTTKRYSGYYFISTRKQFEQLREQSVTYLVTPPPDTAEETP